MRDGAHLGAALRPLHGVLLMQTAGEYRGRERR